jgi:transposase InsO family protein
MLRLPTQAAKQHTSIRLTEMLALEGFPPSIGSVGDACENTCAETVMGLYKNETVSKGSPFRVGPLKNLGDVEKITLPWVQWYNAERLRSYLGTLHPRSLKLATTLRATFHQPMTSPT